MHALVKFCDAQTDRLIWYYQLAGRGRYRGEFRCLIRYNQVGGREEKVFFKDRDDQTSV
jgi:hypothetical protein